MSEPGTSQIRAFLNQIYGENINRKFELKGSQVLVGRAYIADIRLECPSVSRKHCILNYTDDGWKIKDNNSQNGTWVSGQKLEALQPHLLQCGDIIFLGPPTELPQAFCYDIRYASEDSPQKFSVEDISHQPEMVQTVNPETRNLCVRNILPMEMNENRPVDATNEDPEVIVVSPEKQYPRMEIPSVVNSTSFNSEPFLATSSPLGPTAELSISFESPQVSSPSFAQEKSPEKAKWVPVIKSIGSVDSSIGSVMGEQINEISSTESGQAEDSQSLLPTNNDHVSDHNYVSMEVQSEVDLMARELKRLKTEQAVVLRKYEYVVKRNNKKLEKKYNEYKKLKDEIKNLESNAVKKAKKEILETIEEDLVCNICTEILIKPIVLDCSHTFCEFCIKEWKKKKNECPMCRQKMKSMTRILTLESFIDKALATLTPEQRDKRDQVIKDRTLAEQQFKAQNSSEGNVYYRRRRSSYRFRRVPRRRIPPLLPPPAIPVQSNPNHPSTSSINHVNELNTNLLYPVPIVSLPRVMDTRNYRVPEVIISDDEMETSISIYVS